MKQQQHQDEELLAFEPLVRELRGNAGTSLAALADSEESSDVGTTVDLREARSRSIFSTSSSNLTEKFPLCGLPSSFPKTELPVI